VSLTLRHLAVAALLGTVGFDAAAIADAGLSPPRGYRQWFHVNTQIVDKNSPLYEIFGGMHNIYLSPGGVSALKDGKKYPDGTIFVDDVHAFTVDKDSYVEGERTLLAVMVRDAKKYTTTGGWGFQAWVNGNAKSPAVSDPVKQCFGCHTQTLAIPRPEEHQYVFSTYIP
jgi:Cytochrome P460